MTQRSLVKSVVVASIVLVGCAGRVTTSDDHSSHASEPEGHTVRGSQQSSGLPPSAASATSCLSSSRRRNEWAMIRTGPADSVAAWIVYPERTTKAPVVIVIHEIFGLTTWVRGIADQLAADGFVAIAPDLLTMKNLPTGPDSVVARAATVAIRTPVPADPHRQLAAVAAYGIALAAAQQRYVIDGLRCGGSA